MITIYILKCADGSHYTGITQDLEVRLAAHNKGKVSYTKNKLPVSVLHTETQPSRKEAAKLERYIKTTGAWKYICRLNLYY